MKTTAHFSRYEKHYSSVAEALPKVELSWKDEKGKMEHATELNGICFALAKIYTPLSADTLVDTLRCMKNKQNEPALVALKVDTNRIKSFFSSVEDHKKKLKDAQKPKKEAPKPAITK